MSSPRTDSVRHITKQKQIADELSQAQPTLGKLFCHIVELKQWKGSHFRKTVRNTKTSWAWAEPSSANTEIKIETKWSFNLVIWLVRKVIKICQYNRLWNVGWHHFFLIKIDKFYENPLMGWKFISKMKIHQCDK